MWHESEESSENSDNSEDEAASDIKSNGQSEPDSAELPSQTDENDVNKSNEDSEYEESDNVKDDDDDASNDSDDNGSASSSSPSTSSSDQSTRNKRNNKRKIDDRTRKLLEDNNYLRRSSRAKSDKEKKPKKGSSEDDSESESWSDDNHRSRKQPQKKNKVKHESPIKRSKAKSSVDYTEKDTDEDVDEDDVLEWEQEPEAEVAAADASVVTESIERVLKHRIGNVGATGSATTCYNVQERGDPNKLLAQNPDIKQEDQFLIKWVGWSHLHNTWESEASIAAMNASGIKKLQNYLKKKKEHDAWRAVADKEYIEVVDCEEAMADDLCETYKEVERIVAHRISTTDKLRNDYLIKWCGLSYADCTWEDDVLIPRNLVEDYHSKLALYKYPNMKAPVLRRRPKFVKLDETPSYLLPPGREGQILRDYQLEGVNWMLHAWCKGNSCILADEMGLGKTIQSISFLSSLHHRYDLYGPFLVVVPLSTIAAWQKEFAQWAPSLNMITYMGDGVSREQIREFDFFVPSSKKVIGRNAVLTTYEILLKDKPFLGSFKWAALAVDEAHRLKNDESLLYKCLSSFSCDHRLLITGTPLQNSLKELWALLHFIMPEKFYSWEEFENDHNDKDHKGISALHRKLEPYLLRRVKKDVEKSLPPKLEQILRVDMTAQQKQFYKWILTKNYRELSKGVKGSISGFVNLVMELKKCCNHASLVRNYDYYENEAQARIQQLLKSSGKLILLDKLLWRLKETGHRVLIFSQMVMMLDILQEYLQLRRWQYQRLDGSMRADLRKQALDHFNAEGSIDFCFLLSTRAGGLGINLATADTVIIFDSDWNPQNDLQAMSRAHRIGQTKQEEIVERAKRKLVLDHLVIQRMDTTGKTVLSKTSKNGTSSVPFDKQDLNAILKFGAAELFKEKEGEEQEPEVDIDRILMVAETREAEETQETNNDLLSSFKYANFTIDEEKDLAEAAAAAGTEENEWDRIIPEEDRLKIEESEKAKAISELELAPRQRTKVLEGADNDSDESDSDAESAKKKRKKAWGEFSTVELKRFVRSLRKFACPLERLDALAQDAELEEHSATELQRLTEAVLEGCQKAEDDINFGVKQAKEDDKNGKDKGPVFKFANVVDVNVKPIRKMHGILQPLHMAIPPPSSAAFKAPLNARPQKGWNIPWKSDSDSAVLRGVYKYGMGNWDQILMDPELSLEQICVKDKNFKPQRTHLQQRVDYLLKLMNSPKLLKSPKKVTNNVPRKRKPAEDKPKAVPEKKKKDHHARELSSPSTASGNRSFVDQLSLLTIDSAMYAAALEDRGDRPFKECVQMMKPVQKYIKKLADSKTDKDASKYLHKLGDNCRDQLEELLKRKPKTNLRKWYNFMWIFLSKFLSQEPAELVERYRQLCPGSSRHKHEKHEKHSHAKDKDRHPETKDDKSKKIKKEKDHKERHHKDRDHGHHVRHPVVPASFPSSTLTRPPAPPLLASPHKV